MKLYLAGPDVFRPDAQAWAAQARAHSDCLLVVFFRADFMSLLETHPKIASKIALALARHLGGRLRQANAGARQAGHL